MTLDRDFRELTLWQMIFCRKKFDMQTQAFANFSTIEHHIMLALSLIALVNCGPIPPPEFDDPPEVDGCFDGDGISGDSEGEPPPEEYQGSLWLCDGQRKATIVAEVCNDPILNSCPTVPIQEFTPFGFGPFVTDEDLSIDEDFEGGSIFAPNVGACCLQGIDPEHPDILTTAEVDCAAKACIDATLKYIFCASQHWQPRRNSMGPYRTFRDVSQTRSLTSKPS